MDEFEQRNRSFVERMAADDHVRRLSHEWLVASAKHEYSYHFTWLGRPVIQYPQDILAVQEIIWKVKPDLIVETGIARGGSMTLSASMLELLGGEREVVGIDVDIRIHNRRELESHPLAHRIRMIEGSSVDERVVRQVKDLAQAKSRVLVMLDSNHTHDHVLEELQLYSPLVAKGSYLVVFDTIIEDMPADFFPDRPWGPGNNPKTAVREFLRHNDRFETDQALERKLLISSAPDGYLHCVRD